jgi:hypothetical protein
VRVSSQRLHFHRLKTDFLERRLLRSGDGG